MRETRQSQATRESIFKIPVHRLVPMGFPRVELPIESRRSRRVLHKVWNTKTEYVSVCVEDAERDAELA